MEVTNMNKSELRSAVMATGSHHFDRKTMKFFGDTMTNYGIRETTIKTNWNATGGYDEKGREIAVFELYRRRPVKHGLCKSVYFNKIDFSTVSPIN